jgi:hypothetical protein
VTLTVVIHPCVRATVERMSNTLDKTLSELIAELVTAADDDLRQSLNPQQAVEYDQGKFDFVAYRDAMKRRHTQASVSEAA